MKFTDPKPFDDKNIEEMLFRYQELDQDISDASDEKTELMSQVKKVHFKDLKPDVHGNINDRVVDPKFINEYNKIDERERRAREEKVVIYQKLYEWRYPRNDVSYDWWIKAEKSYFRFDRNKLILEIRQ